MGHELTHGFDDSGKVGPFLYNISKKVFSHLLTKCCKLITIDPPLYKTRQIYPKESFRDRW